MANRRPKPEEIVTMLRQVDVLVGQGKTRIDAIREIGVVEQTYYRWRKQYGGMGTDQVKELKRLQKENDRLRRAVSDLTLEKLILSEAARETSKPRTSPHLHQSGPQQAEFIRAFDLPCPWPASDHTTTSTKGPRG